MALGDYILCCECECKLIYDGDRGQREWWNDRWGKDPQIKCPDCEQPAQDEPVALNREYAQRLIEALYENGDPVSVDAAEEFERLLTSPQAREPVALKDGECWPEYVMQEWDYWRKQIADGDKGSAPRDWFEELAELKLVSAPPQAREQQPCPYVVSTREGTHHCSLSAREWVGLTDEEREMHIRYGSTLTDIALSIEAKLKEKNT